jgi:hypothetical protein
LLAAAGIGHNFAVAIRNEYGWEVTPPIPAHWQQTFVYNEFQAEVKVTSIEIKMDAGADEEAQKQRATAFVENLMRAIGLQERTQYRARFASMAKFDREKQTRSITLQCEPARLRTSGHVDFRRTNAKGAISFDSRDQRFKDALALASAAGTSDTFRRMIDFRLAYYADPQHHLDHLLNIMELAETAFGHEHFAAKKLEIDLSKLQEARKITHNKEIDIGRHPGQTLAKQRPPTAEELKLCEEVVDAIIAGYSKKVEQKIMADAGSANPKQEQLNMSELS